VPNSLDEGDGMTPEAEYKSMKVIIIIAIAI